MGRRGRAAVAAGAARADLRDVPDVALAVAFTDGSDAAYEELYRRYAQAIFDHLRWTVREPAVAEDLAQTTFLLALERRASLRDPSAVRGWLYRIAHNLAMNHVTRTRRTDELDDATPIAFGEPGPERRAEAEDSAALVWDAAASLEPRQFAVLDLSLRKGLSSAEIGEVLQIDVAAASLAVHRAREALGNAVRFLLVARRRQHCERLAELVPDGVRRLTPEQRTTVDHHMRRCEDCQRMALVLTAADELFAALPLIVLPTGLLAPPRPHGPRPVRSRRGRHAAQRMLRSPVGVAATVVVAVAVVGLAVVPALRDGEDAPTGAPGPTSGSGAATALLAVAGVPFEAGPVAAAPTDAVYRGVACPTATRCYAVAESSAGGVVVTSADAGHTWSATTVAGATALESIDCTSERSCVSGGYTGADESTVILLTEDGGTTWTAADAPADASVTVIRCPDAVSCIAVGERQQPRTASVLASQDGGATWQARTPPSTVYGPGYVAGARCLDAAHCWVVGDGIWFTDDLGATWVDVAPRMPECTVGICGGPLHTLADVDFTSMTDGWVVGGEPCGGYGITECPSYIADTSDAGGSWAEGGSQPTLPFAQQILCAGPNCLVAGRTFTDSVLSVSTDGGDSWKETQRLPTVVNALGCSPDDRVCVVAGGQDGTGVLLSASIR